ncbi:MAG: TRAP transporter small permease [Rubrivivax sp.]|nr:TRAP transporter small permease [Rubrivivax sp.]
MNAAARVLKLMQRAEQLGTTAAFLLMVLVLGWDILGRELLGGGKIWATPVAVYANVFIAFIGIGVASAGGAHLRPRFLDKLAPRAWDAAFDRFSDAGFALFCLAAAVLCTQMLLETIQLAETDPVLNTAIWPMQCFLVAGFALGSLRHALYAAFPALRPAPAGGENAPPTEEQVRELSGAPQGR